MSIKNEIEKLECQKNKVIDPILEKYYPNFDGKSFKVTNLIKISEIIINNSILKQTAGRSRILYNN